MNNVKKAAAKVWRYDIVHTAIYSMIINIIVECLNRRNLMGFAQPFINPVIFLYNTLMIMSTMSLVLLVRRRAFGYTFVAMVWIGLALTNFIMLSYRKTPFTAMDLYLIRDALKIIHVYLNVFKIILIIVGVTLVIACLVIVWKKCPIIQYEITKKKFYIYGVVQVLLVVLFTYGFSTTLLLNNVVETHYGNLAKAYKKYGFVHCFVSSLVDRGISRSNEYSPEYMEQIKQQLDSGQIAVSKKTPNVIYVQLESFFNPRKVKGLQFSKNPLPNFEYLVANYSSGYLSMPCFGAGTCNSEFEVQTGINLDDFGPGEYPYRTIMQSSVCESVAYNLKNLGYSTHAIHNNDATFYGRNKVFSHLGYDTFTSIEYMSNVEYTPYNWAKDKVLVDEIKKALDSSEGTDYIFSISVQGHGDYPNEYPEGFVPEITINNFYDAGNEKAFQYYVNEIHEMDDFIGELVNMLSTRDEETVLVLYGDHLPTFDIADENLVNGDIYQTQYVIWSNFEMERKVVDLEAFQLSAYVLERIGISEGYIMKYHQLKRDDENYLKNLKVLEYDILYGKKEIYNGVSPYEATDIKMGIDDIVIDEVYNYKDYVCISGKNFNEFSVVFINNKEYPVEMISNKLLRIKGAKTKSTDEVAVAQRGSDKIELSRVIFKVK